MKLSKESIVLMCVGILDLVSTLIWVNTHGAEEANPLFRHYLQLGPAWFAMMKLVMLAAPIFLLEWARIRRPVFTRHASRFAAGAYLVMYVVGFAKLNPQLFEPRPQRLAVAMSSSFGLAQPVEEAEPSIANYRTETDQPYSEPAVVGEGLR
jgi:hypothetical protein